MASLTPRLDALEQNYLINGALDIWQRGTSFSSGAEYTADRFRSTVATLTYERVTDVPSEIAVNYSMKVTGNGSLSPGLEQRIERNNIRHLINKEVTYSFYAKVNTGTEDISVRVRNADALDDWSTDTTVSTTSLGSVTTTWTRFNITFTVTSNMANNGFSVEAFSDSLGNTVELFMTGFMLSKGNTVYDFSTAGKTIDNILEKCYRYLQLSRKGYMGGFNASDVFIGGVFPVQMRSAPTMILNSAATFTFRRNGGNFVTITSGAALGSQSSSIAGFHTRLTGTFSGSFGAQDHAAMDQSGMIIFDAEL